MILITGSKGQLGTELCQLLEEQQIEYIGTDSSELDITKENDVTDFIEKNKPTVIFHCAAYTAVDKAEDEGKELNRLVNVAGTRNIAKAAKNVGAKLVYISTDYVFDGELYDGEYSPEDKTNPINEYGRAKLLGEAAVKEEMEDSNYYIIRTSWVFGQFGNNFVFTMKRLASTMDRLTIVNDQYGRPTWTRTLAEFMLYVIENEAPFGVYHLSNDDSCTWFEFAKEILKNEDIEIAPVTSKEFIQKASRPKHSIMNLQKTKELGFKIPTWQEALKLFLDKQ